MLSVRLSTWKKWNPRWI